VRRRIDLSVAPRFLWECLNSRAVSPFPVPATSNPAGEFIALGFPVRFMPKVMGLIMPERLSIGGLAVSPGKHCTNRVSDKPTADSTASNRSPCVAGLASNAAGSSFPPSL
jgi:hypothetical protein